ncbi:ParB family transcriptional regulator, chromosome partitioning protein [Azospirillaceae bacterium]
MRLEVIPIALIDSGDRARVDYKGIEELVLSIKDNGLIHPLAVEESNGRFLLRAGGRRLLALKKLEWKEIPCRIYDRTLSDLEQKSIELAENLDREDFTWQEKVKLQKEIHDLQTQIHGASSKSGTGWSERDTAALTGRAIGSVHADIQLANAIERIPELEKCKTKDEANKMLSKLKETMVREELAKRLMAKKSVTNEDLAKVNLINCFIVDDFFDGVKRIPDGSVDLIELDPPYAIQLDKNKQSSTSYNPSVSIYHEVTEENYPSFMTKVLHNCYRVMSSSGWIVIWHGLEWKDMVYQIALEMGFKGSLMGGIWYKSGHPGQTNHPEIKLASSYEPFLYMYKGDATIIKQGRSNVFAYERVPAGMKVHPTERPIELIQEIIGTFCWPSSRIFVPFLGSGNTLLAATNLGMTGLGFDNEKENKDTFTLKVYNQPWGKFTTR